MRFILKPDKFVIELKSPGKANPTWMGHGMFKGTFTVTLTHRDVNVVVEVEVEVTVTVVLVEEVVLVEVVVKVEVAVDVVVGNGVIAGVVSPMPITPHAMRAPEFPVVCDNDVFPSPRSSVPLCSCKN